MTTIKPQRNLDRAVTSTRRRIINQIRKEQQRHKDGAGSSARELIMQRQAEAKKRKDETFYRWVRMLLDGATSQAVAVLRSTGSTVPVKTSSGWQDTILAMTDFKTISVEWPLPYWARKFEGKITPNAAIEVFASGKGVLYHEMGHLEFTVPYPQLMGRYNATPEGNERPLTNAHHMMWNMLEDQRMEAAVLRAVPRKRSYFVAMFMQYLHEQGNEALVYPLVSGRDYVPTDIRNAYRKVSLYDADLVDVIVDRYKAATTYQEMVSAIFDLYDLINLHPGAPSPTSDHNQWASSIPTDEVDDRIANSSSDSKDEGDESAPGGGDESDDGDSAGKDNADGDSAGDTSGSDNANEGNGDDAEGNGDDAEGNGDGTPSPQPGSEAGEASHDRILQERNKALDEIRADGDYVQAVSNAYALIDSGAIFEMPEDDEKDMCPSVAAACMPVAVGIESALSDFVTTAAPRWEGHLDEGVIVPLDFRTRSVGDYDYHTAQIGDSNMGLDLHVSFLADVSISMSYLTSDGQSTLVGAMSRAMYAMAIATQRLNIGSTFSVWSTPEHTYRLWSDGDIRPLELPTFGGTDPTVALDDLSTHNPEGASRHLVILFTDGDLDYQFTFDRWRSPERTLVMIEYGKDSPSQRYGADYGFTVQNIEEIPEKMTMMVADLLS